MQTLLRHVETICSCCILWTKTACHTFWAENTLGLQFFETTQKCLVVPSQLAREVPGNMLGRNSACCISLGSRHPAGQRTLVCTTQGTNAKDGFAALGASKRTCVQGVLILCLGKLLQRHCHSGVRWVKTSMSSSSSSNGNTSRSLLKVSKQINKKKKT